MAHVLAPPPARPVPGDPAVRLDGRCVQCLRVRKLTVHGRIHRELAELDPFCSTECCREWYGIPLPYTKVGARG